MMWMDMSRFKCATRNLEEYRIKYEKNVVPEAKKDGLARGSCLHEIIYGKFIRLSDEEINYILDTKDGGYSKEIQARAWAMYPAYKEWDARPDTPSIVWIEEEWSFKIPGSEHWMCGKTDQLRKLESPNQDGDRIYELKSAWHKFDLAKLEKNWDEMDGNDPQADFEILGARHGMEQKYDPDGLIIVNVVETNPAHVECSELVTRSELQLLRTMREVEMLCDMIEFLKGKYGVDEPWIHRPSPKFDPFACVHSECEYRFLCGTDARSWDLTGYKKRDEHLNLLKNSTEPAADKPEI